SSRGMAVGDLFNDGNLCVVINNMDASPTVLCHKPQNKNHWVELHLVGSGKSPRDAVGATVYVTAGAQRQRGDIVAGGSFASSSDPRVHVGLGAVKKVDEVEIHWPDGRKQALSPPEVDRIVTVEESAGPVEAAGMAR
ncbi:MAG: ASPIC/UnbV domain-containing protein, partial [Janthinobacterium lividum]